jgi:transcriptional adapter 3
MKPKAKEKSSKLSFPDVAPLDFIRNCPRYASILSRSSGDGVGIEEIDNLQMELESLLVNAIERKRKFKIELMVLENQRDKNDGFKLQKTFSQPSTPKTPSHVKKIKSMGAIGKLGSISKPIEGATLIV